jgi:hypothetical protein
MRGVIRIGESNITPVTPQLQHLVQHQTALDMIMPSSKLPTALVSTGVASSGRTADDDHHHHHHGEAVAFPNLQEDGWVERSAPIPHERPESQHLIMPPRPSARAQHRTARMTMTTSIISVVIITTTATITIITDLATRPGSFWSEALPRALRASKACAQWAPLASASRDASSLSSCADDENDVSRHSCADSVSASPLQVNV